MIINVYEKYISFFRIFCRNKYFWRCFCRPRSLTFELAMFCVIYFWANVKQLPATSPTLLTMSSGWCLWKAIRLEAFIETFLFAIKKLSIMKTLYRSYLLSPFFNRLIVLFISFPFSCLFLILRANPSLPNIKRLCEDRLWIIHSKRASERDYGRKSDFMYYRSPDAIYNRWELVARAGYVFQCDLR